jgi:hypothetical protein
MEHKLIPATDFCTHHNIEVTFLYTLNEYGLINIITESEKVFVEEDELCKLEKMMHLHYELNINLEGIDAVTHILNKLETAQNEMAMLKNRLSFYERSK